MFVFGEVQTPLSETVKLVEDIVRGQIIEIVRPGSALIIYCRLADKYLRSLGPASLPTFVHLVSYPQKISFSSSVTIAAKSIGCELIFPGKMFANVPRKRLSAPEKTSTSMWMKTKL